jgi:hypothetical protein
MSLARLLIAIGIVFVVAGLLVAIGARLPFRLGRLPGDFVWRGKNSTFYFPLATCLLLSILLSFVFWLIGRR